MLTPHKDSLNLLDTGRTECVAFRGQVRPQAAVRQGSTSLHKVAARATSRDGSAEDCSHDVHPCLSEWRH